MPPLPRSCRIRIPRKVWTQLTWGLLVTYLILGVATFRDYGITWDEYWHATYGDYILAWYESLFRDDRALTFWNLHLRGGFFDALGQLAARASPIGLYETRHLVGLAFGALAAVGVYKFARHLVGPAAGFLAAFFLLLTPAFYGHTFNNPKDPPFAALFALSMSYVVQSIRFFPVIPRALIVKLGLFTGLALGIRIAGIQLLASLAVVFGIWLVLHRGMRDRSSASAAVLLTSLVGRFAARFLAVAAIAYLVMAVWWPRAQVDPIRGPLWALQHAARFDWTSTVLFEGELIPASKLPWYYVGKWFVLTLPEFYFLALAGGLVAAAVALGELFQERRPRIDPGRLAAYIVLGVWVVGPLAYTALASDTIVYDGARHFFFVIPGLAVAAAASVIELARRPRFAPLATLVGAGVLVSCAVTIVDMVQLHPYQSVFFNRLLAGGLAKASRLYETDYWGASYKEGSEWIGRNYTTIGARGPRKVASCGFPLSTTYFLPPEGFRYVGSCDEGRRMTELPDIFLATTRWRCHESFSGPIVHVVERQGAPLLHVKEVADADLAATYCLNSPAHRRPP